MTYICYTNGRAVSLKKWIITAEGVPYTDAMQTDPAVQRWLGTGYLVLKDTDAPAIPAAPTPETPPAPVIAVSTPPEETLEAPVFNREIPPVVAQDATTTEAPVMTETPSAVVVSTASPSPVVIKINPDITTGAPAPVSAPQPVVVNIEPAPVVVEQQPQQPAPVPEVPGAPPAPEKKVTAVVADPSVFVTEAEFQKMEAEDAEKKRQTAEVVDVVVTDAQNPAIKTFMPMDEAIQKDLETLDKELKDIAKKQEIVVPEKKN